MINKIINVAESEGWAVTVKHSSENTVTFKFFNITPYGQDFSFSAEMINGDIVSLLRSICDNYYSFDPNYEAYQWIGDNGEGKDCEPQNDIGIVNDMVAAANMVLNLHYHLSSMNTEDVSK